MGIPNAFMDMRAAAWPRMLRLKAPSLSPARESAPATAGGECRGEAQVKGPSISATRTPMRTRAGLCFSFLSLTEEGAAWLTPLACANGFCTGRQ